MTNISFFRWFVTFTNDPRFNGTCAVRGWAGKGAAFVLPRALHSLEDDLPV